MTSLRAAVKALMYCSNLTAMLLTGLIAQLTPSTRTHHSATLLPLCGPIWKRRVLHSLCTCWMRTKAHALSELSDEVAGCRLTLSPECVQIVRGHHTHMSLQICRHRICSTAYLDVTRMACLQSVDRKGT